jgi:hypothetical protein
MMSSVAKSLGNYGQEESIHTSGDRIPEVGDLECAFPSRYLELLPKWEDLSNDEKSGRGPFCDALQHLFFEGGRLSDFGIVPKPGHDIAKIMRYVRATLGDFGPKHEHKIGGIAHMLNKWCIVQVCED